MINKIALTTLAVSSFALPAAAGVYLNLETSSKFAGTDYSKTTTDMFIGYEDSYGSLDYFIEGGPSLTAPDDGKVETVPAGKAGFSVKVTDRLKVYGELSASLNEGTNDYGTKAGVKYTF